MSLAGTASLWAVCSAVGCSILDALEWSQPRRLVSSLGHALLSSEAAARFSWAAFVQLCELPSAASTAQGVDGWRDRERLIKRGRAILQ